MFSGTLPDTAQDALAILGKSKILDFAYMAGGSALALQLGHRKSVDFDFFTPNNFDIGEMRDKLKSLGRYQIESEGYKTMVGEFNEVKFSLFYYKYPLIDATIKYDEVTLASPKDIAAMKLEAILGRATKKDYIDLYFMAKKVFKLDEMLVYYDQKFGILAENKLTLLKSLQYFEDAEVSSMPIMIEIVGWEEVKSFLRNEAARMWRLDG